jgi:hypothetical protein
MIAPETWAAVPTRLWFQITEFSIRALSST